MVSALTSSRAMASRCILGSQATGLRPCGWLPQGSLSEVWRALCYISIAFVDVCFDVMKSDCVKATGCRPRGWFPRRSLGEVWCAVCYISIGGLVSALTSSRLTMSRCIFGARQSVCDRWQWFWVTLQGTLSCFIHEGWRVFIIRTTMFTIVNHDQLLRQIKQSSKHSNNGFNQWLEILAVEDLPAKLRKSGKSDLKFSTISE